MTQPEHLAVDKERWQRAQAWELAFWQQAQQKRGARRLAYWALRPALAALGSKRASGDDWNLLWRDHLDGYEFLPTDLGDMIELGCGPYTNTRLILQGRTARRVVCSDPLAASYLEFKHRWLARAAQKGRVEVDAHPIEECPFPPESFDVVVLINVLDHVMDAALCLERAVNLVRPGGYFVFGQNLTDSDDTGRTEWFDEGHPIRLAMDDVRPFLARFEPLVHKVLEDSDPLSTQTSLLAFAGRRTSPKALAPPA